MTAKFLLALSIIYDSFRFQVVKFKINDAVFCRYLNHALPGSTKRAVFNAATMTIVRGEDIGILSHYK